MQRKLPWWFYLLVPPVAAVIVWVCGGTETGLLNDITGGGFRARGRLAAAQVALPQSQPPGSGDGHGR
jgi:hypothetical protein